MKVLTGAKCGRVRVTRLEMKELFADNGLGGEVRLPPTRAPTSERIKVNL